MDNEFPLAEGPGLMNDLSLPADDAHSIWHKCLALIRPRVNGQSYKTWFEPIVPVRLEASTFFIQVPSQFFFEWLEEHYYSLITEVLTQILRSECTLSCEIPLEEREIDLDPPSAIPASTAAPGTTVGSIALDRMGASQQRSTPVTPTLNPRYTFENYIKGESNQFARAAALAIGNNPGGTSFNPLVIYGGVGLGKTHLVHAIGNHLIAADRSKPVLYTSSEKFTVDFVEAIQKDRISDF